MLKHGDLAKFFAFKMQKRFPFKNTKLQNQETAVGEAPKLNIVDTLNGNRMNPSDDASYA